MEELAKVKEENHSIKTRSKQ